MILTEDEIIALTKRKQHHAQACVLRAMGIAHKQRPDGTLVVSRIVVEALLGVSSTPAPKTKEPNWEYA